MPSPTFRTNTFLRFFRYVGPLLLWMGVLFFMSTDRGSAANTTPAIHSILLRLWPDASRYLSPETIGRVDWDLRKTAHVIEYTVLSLLAFRAIAYGDRQQLRARNVLLPLLIGIAYAASDEIHQSFVPSRTGAAADVFTDTFGVLLGMVLSLWRRCQLYQKNAPSGKTQAVTPLQAD